MEVLCPADEVKLIAKRRQEEEKNKTRVNLSCWKFHQIFFTSSEIGGWD